METHARSLLKALSYRSLGFLVTASVAWAITGRAGLAASIGLADTLVKIGAYYVHERAWQRVRYGRLRPPEYQI